MLVKKKKGIVSLILAATMVLQVCAGTFSVARNAVAETAGRDSATVIETDSADISDGQNQLVENSYPLTQIDTPLGYELVENNGIITGKFTINKTDEKDTKLNGATFKLSKKTTYGNDQPLPKGNQVKEDFNDKEQTTKAGKVEFDNLPPGTYDLVETKSPDGYIKDTRKFVVVVQNDGKTYLVDASKYNPNEYPLTGVINKPNLDIDLVKPEREPKSLDGEINVLDYYLYKNPAVNESRDERTIDPSLYESMWMKFKLVFPEDVKPKDTFTIKLDDEVDMKGFSVNHKI